MSPADEVMVTLGVVSTSGKPLSPLSHALVSSPGSEPFAGSAASGAWFVAETPEPGTAVSYQVCESPMVTIALPWQVYWIGSFKLLVKTGKPSASVAETGRFVEYDASSACFL